jgi:hypothetical protein
MEDKDKKIIKETISDGVKITEYSDGSTTFKPIQEESKIKKPDTRSWRKKLYDWWTTSNVKPYVKIRDLSDPLDELKKDPARHDGGGSKEAIEVGIKISF